MADEPIPLADETETDRSARRARRTEKDLTRLYDQLHGKYEQVLAELGAQEALYKHRPTLLDIKPTLGKDDSEATAVVLASDWHVEERIRSETVNGRNNYSVPVARARAATFFDRIVRMVKKEQQDVTIKNLVLWLGGDFITSNIHEELPENCALLPIDAMLFASDLLESGIRYILANTELVLTIPCSCGNHSRITKKIHVGSERGNSLEWMMYHNLAKVFRDEKRVRFVIEDSYHTYLRVYGYTVRFHHGHAVRYQGGVGGLHIPLNKALAQWDKTRKADVDCYGHWHTYLPSRRYVGNGSLIGFSPFAIWIKAEYEPPIQAFFLIDKKRGVTVHIPILV